MLEILCAVIRNKLMASKSALIYNLRKNFEVSNDLSFEQLRTMIARGFCAYYLKPGTKKIISYNHLARVKFDVILPSFPYRFSDKIVSIVLNPVTVLLIDTAKVYTVNLANGKVTLHPAP
jgi:hypothetical protein